VHKGSNVITRQLRRITKPSNTVFHVRHPHARVGKTIRR